MICHILMNWLFKKKPQYKASFEFKSNSNFQSEQWEECIPFGSEVGNLLVLLLPRA